MQLLASVCNVTVLIPPHPSAAVVMGAAMMGKCAANISEKRKGEPITTQEQSIDSGRELKSELWDVMVSRA
jgi:ribulose kinase